MVGRACALVALLAGGCRGVLGIETPVLVGGTDGHAADSGEHGDAPIAGDGDGAPIDGLVHLDAPSGKDAPAMVTVPTAVQGAYTDPLSGSTINVKFPNPQTAGHTNVVLIGWVGATTSLGSVTDSAGTLYVPAGPIVSNDGNQVLYYGAVAATGSNTAVVAFTTTVSDIDVRAAEYSGVATVAPIDQVVSNTGTSGACDSGEVMTTNAEDLIVGGNYDLDYVSGVGGGFTQRVLSSPDKDVIEDRVVSTVGSYRATATLQASSPWIMQFVAFKAASGGD